MMSGMRVMAEAPIDDDDDDDRLPMITTRVTCGITQGCLFMRYERKTSFRLSAFFDLVFASQLCDANGSTTLHPSWL
jgi:hypothetical protein